MNLSFAVEVGEQAEDNEKHKQSRDPEGVWL